MVSSSEQIKRNFASLAHQWILCSEWVPSEGESKQLIKTSQQSSSNPHHSSPSVNILWSENLHVGKKKRPSLRAIIHNNASFSESPSPVFSHIKIQRDICLQLFWTVFTYKCIFLSRFRQDNFFTGQSNIMNRGLMF